MSELDMYQSDIESLQDQAMLNTSDDILIRKHQKDRDWETSK